MYPKTKLFLNMTFLILIMLQYGIIGNCKTCALIHKNTSIAWMCFPDFDSASIFGNLLDSKDGGQFRIMPDRQCKYSQGYMKDTNILETVISCDDYAFKVIDFFPRYRKILPNKKTRVFRQNRLIRIVEPIKGKPRFKVIFDPRLDYARGETTLEKKENSILVKNGKHEIHLMTNADYDAVLGSEVIELNQRKFFVLGAMEGEYSIKRSLDTLRWTKVYWLKWVDTLILPEENKENIIRSALLLKLLTYSETGAIIAAATTSIPEDLGTPRTWDYRYCWVRDAAHCADAFKKIGRDYEAKKVMEFIINNGIRDDYVQPLYGIHGETDINEYTLEHLDGFKGSKPVRVGNAAFYQVQNDIYGEIIDIMYLYFAYYEYESKMTTKYWRFLRYCVNQIKFNWRKKDSSIWEFRDIYDHYTFSKFMCFVGVDRAIKLAQHFGKDDFVKQWIDIREEIRNEILSNGYSQEKNAFTISYDSKRLDASVLLMAYHEFLESSDPRMINTVKAIYKDLVFEDYLVKRYNVIDDSGQTHNAFTICAFWLVDALYYIGEQDKARTIYQKLLKRGNHVGLFSEDIELPSKKLIGNFPQAYTHIAIINTSILLSEWSTRRKKIDWSNVKRKKWL
jgi:alpha,alpha-trehalase